MEAKKTKSQPASKQHSLRQWQERRGGLFFWLMVTFRQINVSASLLKPLFSQMERFVMSHGLGLPVHWSGSCRGIIIKHQHHCSGGLVLYSDRSFFVCWQTSFASVSPDKRKDQCHMTRRISFCVPEHMNSKNKTTWSPEPGWFCEMASRNTYAELNEQITAL